jgi:hypothetical protein
MAMARSGMEATSACSASQGASATPRRMTWRTAEATAAASEKRTSIFCGCTLTSTEAPGTSTATIATG